MSNLTTKQKIILGIIVGIMLIIIGIYGYTSIQQEDEMDISNISSEGNNVITQNEQIEDKNAIGGNNEVAQTNTNGNEIINGEETTSGYGNLEGKIVVHITGAVQKTGILVLPEGARIADAIDAANGATEGADLNEVNLAYVLEDGQKIYIPKKGDKAKLEGKAYITSESGNNVIVESKNTDKGVSKKVNINTATQSELEELPGIGPSIATRIIEYRQQNGKFSKIEDLQNVKGIGDAKFGNVKEHIVVK